MSGYNIHPLPPNTIHFAPLKPSIHPRLEIQLNSTLLAQTSIAAAAAPLNDHAEASAKASCTTHMHIQLPDALFIDRDELLDLWSTSSRITEWELRPEIIDIERPVRLVDGVSLCLVVGDEVDELDIPLHARYLVPSELGYTTVQILEYGDFRAGLVCAKQSSSSKHIRGEQNVWRLKWAWRVLIYDDRSTHLPRSTPKHHPPYWYRITSTLRRRHNYSHDMARLRLASVQDYQAAEKARQGSSSVREEENVLICDSDGAAMWQRARTACIPADRKHGTTLLVIQYNNSGRQSEC